jgi:ribonuclease HI
MYCDGCSRSNPGPSGLGVVFMFDGVNIGSVCHYLGEATNNIAEYQGLIYGLRAAKEKGYEEISIFMDSLLVVNQIKGKYQVRAEHLRPLYMEALDLLENEFREYSITHIPREQNTEADKYSKKAVKEKCLNQVIWRVSKNAST